MTARQKAADTVGWFAMFLGAALGVLTVYPVDTQPLTELSLIELFIGGVIAVTLVAFSKRLLQWRIPAHLAVLSPGTTMPGTGQKAVSILGWFATVLDVLIGAWSVSNAATRPKLHELDVIDLLLGVVVAVTLVVMGTRLRQRRSPWGPFLLGFTGSTLLVVLALLRAAQDFNDR